MPQWNNFPVLCKAKRSTTEWMVCLQISVRWYFGFWFCLFCLFSVLLQDKMTLIIFLFGLNLKLENFYLSLPFILLPVSSCATHPSFSRSHLERTWYFSTQSYLTKTISTQKTKNKKTNLKAVCLNDRKEIPFTSILLLPGKWFRFSFCREKRTQAILIQKSPISCPPTPPPKRKTRFCDSLEDAHKE